MVELVKKQTKIFIAISLILVGVAFIGTGLFDGMILEMINQSIQVALGVIFLGAGLLVVAELRSSKK